MSPRKSNGVELNGSELNRNGSELNRNSSELNRNNDPSKSWFHNLNLNQMWLTSKFILTMPFSLAFFQLYYSSYLLLMKDDTLRAVKIQRLFIRAIMYLYLLTILKSISNKKKFCKKNISRRLTISKYYIEYFVLFSYLF